MCDGARKHGERSPQRREPLFISSNRIALFFSLQKERDEEQADERGERACGAPAAGRILGSGRGVVSVVHSPSESVPTSENTIVSGPVCVYVSVRSPSYVM